MASIDKGIKRDDRRTSNGGARPGAGRPAGTKGTRRVPRLSESQVYELLRAIEYYANRDRNPEYSEGYALGRIEGLLQEPLRILRASLGRAALEPILSLVELESYIAERAIKCQPLSLSTERTTNE